MAKHRQKGADEAVNTDGWMMSYADMATVLLAMFIVLSTLGKDQTGVSLEKGLESWRESRANFGLGGLFATSSNVVKGDAPAPNYHGADDAAGEGGGPDADKGPRGRDAEQERLNRFLAEMDRQFKVDKMPRVAGSATVDFFDPLGPAPPYLTARQAEVVGQVLPLLGRDDYRVTLVVWATTPSDTAWARAAEQARLVADELAAAADLSPPARARLVAVGQTWRYPGFQRPVLSLTIAKTEKPPTPP